MPVYEFFCNECKTKFELLLNISDDLLDQTCPECGKKNYQKLVSKFRRLRTENDRIDHIADQLEGMSQPDSMTELREFVKEMGKATDDDMSADLEEEFETDMENQFIEDEK